MGRTGTRCRASERRPTVEALESRQLLSTLVKVADPGDGFDVLDHATAARAKFGVDGSGLAAAVIDTGVDYDNPALGGGLGPGKKVEDGYDFADDSADPIATTSQHGTAVAGILASDDPSRPGVAPGADVVALRVFGDSDDGDFSKVADALQWVVENHAKDNITVVNLSLSDGSNNTIDTFSDDGGVGQRIATLVDDLTALNIPVVVAAGNSFSGQQGTGFPSILPGTIGVTATVGGSKLATDAQRLGPIGGASATALAAPGVGLTAPVNESDVATVEGTSFAAPQVSGAILLLQQIYEQRFDTLPTVSALEGWLKAGSIPVHDATTGLTIGRLDILKAAEQIPAAPGASAPSGRSTSLWNGPSRRRLTSPGRKKPPSRRRRPTPRGSPRRSEAAGPQNHASRHNRRPISPTDPGPIGEETPTGRPSREDRR